MYAPKYKYTHIHWLLIVGACFCCIRSINFISIILLYCSLGVLLRSTIHFRDLRNLSLDVQRSNSSWFLSISTIETDVNNNHKYYRYSIEKMSFIRYKRSSVCAYFWINKFIVIFPSNYLCLLLFKLHFSHIHTVKCTQSHRPNMLTIAGIYSMKWQRIDWSFNLLVFVAVAMYLSTYICCIVVSFHSFS